MPNNLPQSTVLDIRDYIYIDRERVGSLLAQLNDGLPSEKADGSSRANKLRARLGSIFEYDREIGNSQSQTIALADLHVSQLEESAEALGLLADVSEISTRRKDWLRGKVRKKLKPGMILRVQSLTQISDLSSLLINFQQLGEAFERDAYSELDEMLQLFSALYSKPSVLVSIRSYTSTDDFNIAFVGEIPQSHTFGSLQQELLLSRIGPDPTELTSLVQISAVPTESDKTNALTELSYAMNESISKLTNSAGVNRIALDEITQKLGKALADTGLAASPQWPAVSVVPLAIYRHVSPIGELMTELNTENDSQ